MDNQDVDVFNELENMERDLRLKLEELNFFDKDLFDEHFVLMETISTFLTNLIKEFKPAGNKCLMVLSFNDEYVNVLTFEVNSFRKEVFEKCLFETNIRNGDIVVFDGSKFIKSQYVTIEVLKLCCEN